MQKASIYINGTSIDLGDFGYDISLSISDINDISTRKSGKTIIINVPATETNRKVFEHFDNNVSGKTNALVKGKIVSGGLQIEGDVYVYESTNENGKIEYRFQIIFDNANWINAIGEATLSALDLSEYDHALTNANIVNSWNVTDESGYCYPSIDYGSPVVSPTPLQYMRPAVRLSVLINKIFNTKGYTISSEFFSSSYFRSLWLLNPRNYKIDNELEDYNFYAYKSDDQTGLDASGGTLYDGYKWYKITFPDVTTKNGNDSEFYDTTTSVFSANTFIEMTIIYNLCFKLNAINSHQVKFLWGQLVNGKNVQSLLASGRPIGTYQLSGGLPFGQVYDSTNSSFYVGLNTSETATVDILTSYLPAFINGNPEGEKHYTSINGITYSFSGTYADNQTINVSALGGDIRQIDLIKALKQMFNLYFYTNEAERIVYIEPFNTFYTGASRDFSTKLNELEEIRLSYVDNNKNTIFKFKEDSNDTQQANKNYPNLGGYKRTQLNVNAIEEEEIENDLIAHTVMTNSSTNFIGGVPMPIMTTSDNDGRLILDLEPRILYYSGSPSTCQEYGLNGTDYTTYAYFCSYDSETSHNNNLIFGEYGNNKGLFENYYDGIFKIYDGIFDDNQRIPQLLECSLLLTPGDVSNIINATRNKDFRTCVYLNNGRIRGHYYIQEIEDYNPDKASTKCKLIKVLDRDAGFNILTPEVLGDFSPLDFNTDFDL